MPTVVGVNFHPVTKVYYFDPTRLRDLHLGEYVIVETARGREVGQIAETVRDVPANTLSGGLKQIVRRATAWDMLSKELYRQREADALEICKRKAREQNLPLKMVRVEYNFDGGRLLIYFTSDKRIDFRVLVRDLANVFRCRIEMRQIGVRDQAKLLDGVGKCGRRLCCSSWLREFAPVSIKMAKSQNLPLNPTEISGVCGRLLCCLSYENDVYEEARAQMPKIGSSVLTKQGLGRVRKINPLQETMFVQLEDEAIVEITMEDVLENRGKEQARTCGTCGGCSVKRREAGKENSNKPAAMDLSEETELIQ